MPARASWVGNTPRVSSRNASSAVLVLATSRRSRRRRPLRRPRRARPSPSGTPTRWGRTSREIAASRVRRTASSASMMRDRETGPSSWVVRSSSATCAASWVSSAVLRNATAVWSASASRSLGRPGAAVGPSGASPRCCPGSTPPFCTGTTCGLPRRRRRCPSRLTAGAARAPPGSAVARRADTARPAASATAGSSVSGDGVSRDPAAEVRQRLVGLGPRTVGQPVGKRTTQRRRGWNANATSAVASSDNQKPLVRRPTRSPTSTTRTCSRAPRTRRRPRGRGCG